MWIHKHQFKTLCFNIIIVFLYIVALLPNKIILCSPTEYPHSQVKSMALSLNDKFYLSALCPLSFYLNLTGVFVHQSYLKCRLGWFLVFWSYFCLILCTQSNIYFFIRRSSLDNLLFTTNVERNVDGLVRQLINALFRFNVLIFDTVIHFGLIITIRPTVKLFLNALEQIDRGLRYPKFSSRVKNSSLIGLVYMLFTVGR